MGKENIIAQEVLFQLYVQEKKSIKEISTVLKRGQATVLRYMGIYKISRRPQHQWLGRKQTDQAKEKMRLANIGHVLSEDTRKKIGNAHRGRKKPYFSGRIYTKNGYVLVYKPDHPAANSAGYIREHRLVVEKSIGRVLGITEIVHHVNGVKDDNRLENLCILTRSDHGRLHENSEKTKRWRSNMMKKKRKEKYWSTRKIK